MVPLEPDPSLVNFFCHFVQIAAPFSAAGFEIGSHYRVRGFLFPDRITGLPFPPFAR